ncbi:MAG: hypothetical protein EBY39_08185 [Flavobacteriia bacterium]|nr:hypothetical protein [Flavobacteriia bacterium]
MKINKHSYEKLKHQNYFFEATELCEIMGRNKSDKGNIYQARAHNYTTLYYKLFKNLRDMPLDIFELGLGTPNTDVKSSMGVNGRAGASHYGWAEFFSKASIFGADIDDRILFNTDRIKTFYCDQTNPKVIKNMWDHETLKDINFDIILEDGLHAIDAQMCFFENSIHKLKKGGYYIIEDFNHSKMNAYAHRLSKYKYSDLSIDIYQVPPTSQHHKKNLNNSLIIMQKHR